MAESTVWWVSPASPSPPSCHRHLLPADDRARPGAPPRSPRTSAPARAGADRRGRRRRRRRDGALALARDRRRAGACRPPNRDVNLDIGERVHVDAWSADGTARVQLPRRRLDGAPAPRRRRRRRRARRRRGRRQLARPSHRSVNRRLDGTPWKSRSSSLVIAVIFIVRTFKIVPQQHAWVVERLGKFHAHARRRA